MLSVSMLGAINAECRYAGCLNSIKPNHKFKPTFTIRKSFATNDRKKFVGSFVGATTLRTTTFSITTFSTMALSTMTLSITFE
jgi:hypothetical protein